MSDQIRISDTGELESVPTTWDGEPLFSSSTVQENLFAPEPFMQMPGQTSMDPDGCDPDVSDEPEANSPEAVAVARRREMFRGFGWNVS